MSGQVVTPIVSPIESPIRSPIYPQPAVAGGLAAAILDWNPAVTHSLLADTGQTINHVGITAQGTMRDINGLWVRRPNNQVKDSDVLDPTATAWGHSGSGVISDDGTKWTDGVTVGWLFTGGSGSARLEQGSVPIAGYQHYSFIVSVKEGTASTFIIRSDSPSFRRIVFGWVGGVPTQTGSDGGATSTITAEGDG